MFFPLIYSRMLNCVNTTGHPIPEHSALIQEEKPPPDSCEEEYDYNCL